MIRMLKEFEDALLEVLKPELGIGDKSIIFGGTPKSSPALLIKNTGFRIENPGMSEGLEQSSRKRIELLDGTGRKRNFELEEPPRRGSLQVQTPPGKILKEGDDFELNYEDGSLEFKEPPPKGDGNIKVTYEAKKGVVTLKVVKVEADYSLQIWHDDREGADSLGEKMMRALLLAESDLADRGMEIKAQTGSLESNPNGDGYVFKAECQLERELRIEEVVGVIEEVKVTSREPLS